jgi:hypothetical protein
MGPYLQWFLFDDSISMGNIYIKMKLMCGLNKIEQPWNEFGYTSLELQGYNPLFRLLLGVG